MEAPAWWLRVCTWCQPAWIEPGLSHLSGPRFPTLQNEGNIVSPPRMGVRVKSDNACEVEDSPDTSQTLDASKAVCATR